MMPPQPWTVEIRCMSHAKADVCFVYWLFDETCSVPENDGYVGIANKPKQRLAEHRALGKLRWTGFQILFAGTRAECLEREKGYRPQPGIGWNSASGGGSGAKVLSEESKERLRRHFLGRKASEETRAKMRAAHANRPPELKLMLSLKYSELAKGNKSRTGQKHSKEEIAKRAAAMVGNKNAVGNKSALGHTVSPEARAAMSAAAKGHKRRLGAKLSEASRAKISASQKLRFARQKGEVQWQQRSQVQPI